MRRWSHLLPGLAGLTALMVLAGFWLNAVDREGLIQGQCRTQFTPGLPEVPVGPWRPLADVRIVARNVDGKEVATARSAPDGTYRLTLPPGRYTLTGERFNERPPPARIDGQPAPDYSGVVTVRGGSEIVVDFDIPMLGM